MNETTARGWGKGRGGGKGSVKAAGCKPQGSVQRKLKTALENAKNGYDLTGIEIE